MNLFTCLGCLKGLPLPQYFCNLSWNHGFFFIAPLVSDSAKSQQNSFSLIRRGVLDASTVTLCVLNGSSILLSLFATNTRQDVQKRKDNNLVRHEIPVTWPVRRWPNLGLNEKRERPCCQCMLKMVEVRVSWKGL